MNRSVVQLPTLITRFHQNQWTPQQYFQRGNTIQYNFLLSSLGFTGLRAAKLALETSTAAILTGCRHCHIDGDVLIIIIMSILRWAGCCLFQFTPRYIWIECCHMPVSMNSNAIIFTQQRRLSASLDGLLAVHCPGTADRFEGRFDHSWKKLMK